MPRNSMQGSSSSATGNAVSGDVRAGKTFSNATGTGISGTLTDNTGAGIVITPSSSIQAIPAGIYSGSIADGEVSAVNAPTVTSVSPTTGPATTSVAIVGTNFTDVTGVYFGGVAAASYTVNSPTSITAVAPTQSVGTVNIIVVSSSGGTSATSSADQFSPIVTTLDPGNMGSNIALSNNNLTATFSSTSAISLVRSTTSKTTGKWYFEVTVGVNHSNACAEVGIVNSNANLNSTVGSDAYGRGYLCVNGDKYESSLGLSYGATFAQGDVIGVAVDVTDGTLTFYKNGTSQGVAFTDLASLGAVYAAISNGNTNTSILTINFGSNTFAHSIPSGYSAWD